MPPPYKLATPFTASTPPVLNPQDEHAIIELLCSSVNPLFLPSRRCLPYYQASTNRVRSLLQSLRNSGPISTVTKRRTRKRHKTSRKAERVIHAESHTGRPSLSDSMTAGFNSTNRHLEALVSLRDNTASSQTESSNESFEKSDRLPHMDVVFITQSLDHVAFAHLPILVHLASLTHPELPKTRIIPLRPAAEAELSKVLSIPRIGMIGLKHSTEGAKDLLSLVHKEVQPVDVPWLTHATSGDYCSASTNT